MKTDFSKTSFNDNVATTAVIAATMIGVFSSLVASSNVAAAQPAAMQKIDAIIVTAPRIEVTRMPAIVVTASRENKVLVASN